jgi:Amt family ammonium transporter
MTGDEAIESAAHIFVTTNMAAAIATCTVMFFTWFRYGKPDVSMTLNGALAGLVAITAGCDLVTVPGAFLIGIVAGITVVTAIEFIDQKIKIDDPVGAISVHGVCGALGTVLTGLLAEKEGWLYCGDPHFFIVQVTGVAAVILYVAIAAFIVFKTIKSTVGLRVTPKEEIAGLDFEEHGLTSAYADFMPAPEHTLDPAAANIKQDTVSVPQREVLKNIPGLHPVTPDGHAYSLVTIITSKERFLPLKNALEQIGITGMTVTEVHGYGLQKGHTEMYRGASVASRLLPKIRLDIVVSAISPRTIIDVAKQVLYTGKYGDGKIFVSTVDNVVKIRTGEEGFDALQDYPM